MDKVIYSKTNDPTKWANEDYDVIVFATPWDAKKAEAMFNAMAAEIERLRPEARFRAFNNWIVSEEFYELCQQYRHAQEWSDPPVATVFEMLKMELLDHAAGDSLPQEQR